MPALSFIGESGAVQIIPPNVAVAVNLAARGRSFGYIASRLFVNKATIGRWMAQYAEYAEAQLKASMAAEELMNPLVPKAVRVYEDVLDDPRADPNIKQRVAQDVLDRGLGKPVQRSITDERRQVQITYQIIDGPAQLAQPGKDNGKDNGKDSQA